MFEPELSFEEVVWFVYESLPDTIWEKVSFNQLQLLFNLELEFMKSKKLFVEGVLMPCYDECDGLNYFLQFNIVKYDLFLSEEDINEILSLEEEFYADCISTETSTSPSLEDCDNV